MMSSFKRVEAYRVPVCVAVGIWVLWRIVDVFWLSVEPEPVQVPTDLSILNSTAPRSSSITTTELESLTLFAASEDSASIETSTAQSAFENLRETSLQITLSAVAASADPDLSAAVIGVNGEQRVYHVGDTLPIRGAVSISEIFDKTVVISNNGARERLSLDDDDYEGISAVASSTDPAITAGLSVDSPQVSNFIVFQPVLNGLSLESIKIAPGPDSRLFQLLELQAGDEVVSFGGRAIAQLTNPREIEQLISTQDEFSFVIRRGSETRTIEFDKRLLARLSQ